MKKLNLYLMLVFIAGFLLGCAPVKPLNDCMDADWYEIGFNDGIEGKPRSKFQEHIFKCAEYDVHVGREAYFRGRDQGLKIYCAQDPDDIYGPPVKKDKHICPHDLK